MNRSRRLRTASGATVLAALSLTVAACGSGGSGGSATAAATTTPSTTAPAGAPARGRGNFGGGTAVVGLAAAKVKAAALAKYPGTIEQIEKLPDGTYVAHVMRAGKGEVHVRVDASFKVTGVDSGPPGR